MKRILAIIAVSFMTFGSAFAADRATLSDFMPVYASKVGGADMAGIVRLADLSQINRKMTTEQMTEFMGNTHSQTKTIYSMADAGDTLMTPREFCHYLSDTVFESAAGAFVSKKQKSQLRQRMRFMDVADKGDKLSAEEISALLGGFVVDDASVATVKSIISGLK